MIAEIYQTTDPQEALDRINEYGIEYVYIGRQERDTYKLNQPQQINKFRLIMTPVYEQGGVIIFGR